MKLSFGLLGLFTATETKWLKTETEIQNAYFNGEPINLRDTNKKSPPESIKKNWLDCGDKPALPDHAVAVECVGPFCVAVCPIGWRSQGRWMTRCRNDNNWSHSELSPCVSCPDMSDELATATETANGVSVQTKFSSKNMPRIELKCENPTHLLLSKNGFLSKGKRRERDIECWCRKNEATKLKSCAWSFDRNPWFPSDMHSVECRKEINYCGLDVSKHFPLKYDYQFIGNHVEYYDYFHFNAPDFSHGIHIGFSEGFKGHHDSKWEIVLGGWYGTRHLIRDKNQRPVEGIVSKNNSNREEYDQLRNDFIIQVTDGNIGIYFSSFGKKGNLLLELNDERIIKSKLTTLVATGSRWNATGSMHIRGVCST